MEELLDSRKFDVNDVSTKPLTAPLHLAISKKSASVDVIKILFKRGADLEARDKRNHTPLIRACYYGKESVIDVLINLGADIEARTPKHGFTGLHIATLEGHNASVRRLLERGAAVDSRTQAGDTALHLAAWEGLPEVVKSLADSGAALEAKTAEGYTPLLVAILEEEAETARELVSLGADVNARSDGEMASERGTAVEIAARRGLAEVVRIL